MDMARPRITGPRITKTIGPNTPWEDIPAHLTVADIEAYLRVGRTAAYAFMREHGIRIGARTLRVPREALRGQ